MPIKQQTAEKACEAVLDRAGCSLAVRDAIDARIIGEVRAETASKGDNGFTSNQEEAGGWIEMKSGLVPADANNDGMLNAWESRHGLDPNDPSDGSKDRNGDGCTNVEKSIDGLVPQWHL